MRFDILLALTALATSTAGLVIPSNDLQSRDLEAREGVVDDMTDYEVFRRTDPLREAARHHRATTNLPSRHSTFHVPAAPSTHRPEYHYSGHDVRKAVYDSHLEAERVKTISKTQQKKSPLKHFSNHPHEVPHAHGGGSRPLPHMTVDRTHAHHPPGREFPLPNHHNPGAPGPARVITQQTRMGHQTFRGVISHDQSRTPGPGYNDHFQVKEHRHRP